MDPAFYVQKIKKILTLNCSELLQAYDNVIKAPRVHTQSAAGIKTNI
ncbi:MAG: hypothetical protein CFH41_00097 [Alphaproteobacteria bacterium MarineAlpha11_Bin1]|nr:MAG: hypothetical protein CFH41_00097 [Alphaproteobacteria bacterium MarineAlpha11_Bin1]